MSTKKHTDFLKFAGRRLGRPLRGGRLQAMQQAENNILIAKDVLDLPAINPHHFFDRDYKNLWLEIGFGNGEHLVGQAENHQDIGFIGCEPFLNGVSAAAREVAQKQLDNIRIWPDEALNFLSKWPSACLQRIYLLFSDPWPKTRQHKRRVIQQPTVELFSRLLQPGGTLCLATDHIDLAEWMLLHVVTHPDLQWTNAETGDWLTPPPDWIETRYQQKAALQGRPAYFMNFVRV